ncbi:hypothetical protein GGR56DRAFT_121337 [Xylariaceae sp. FL0804]|nr:hypothetical protein GGR56DRAFT_121337 [Xylariaceae sp. FL0804]
MPAKTLLSLPSELLHSICKFTVDVDALERAFTMVEVLELTKTLRVLGHTCRLLEQIAAPVLADTFKRPMDSYCRYGELLTVIREILDDKSLAKSLPVLQCDHWGTICQPNEDDMKALEVATKAFRMPPPRTWILEEHQLLHYLQWGDDKGDKDRVYQHQSNLLHIALLSLPSLTTVNLNFDYFAFRYLTPGSLPTLKDATIEFQWQNGDWRCPPTLSSRLSEAAPNLEQLCVRHCFGCSEMRLHNLRRATFENCCFGPHDLKRLLRSCSRLESFEYESCQDFHDLKRDLKDLLRSCSRLESFEYESAQEAVARLLDNPSELVEIFEDEAVLPDFIASLLPARHSLRNVVLRGVRPAESMYFAENLKQFEVLEIPEAWARSMGHGVMIPE